MDQQLKEQSLTYTHDAGDINVGHEYENKLSCWITLRCLQNFPDDLLVSTNVDGLKPLDDVVIESGTKKILMQIKHQSRPTEINEDGVRKEKNNLALSKCSDAYDKLIKNDLFKNAVVVIFTNRTIDPKNQLLSEVKEVTDCKEIEFLNTTGGKIYKLNADANCKYNSKFADNCYFLANQRGIKNINEDTKKTISQLLSVKEKKVCDSILDCYHECIENYNKLLGFDLYKMSKNIIMKLLLYSCLNNNFNESDTITLNSYNQKEISNKLWNIIKRGKVLCLKHVPDIKRFIQFHITEEVKHFKTTGAIDNDYENFYIKTIFCEPEALTSTKLETILWIMEKIPLLVEVDKDNYEQYYNNLFELCRQSNLGIIICTNDKLELSKCVQYLDQIDDADFKEDILEMQVSLQNRSTSSLKRILFEENSTNINKFTLTDIIQMLAHNPFIIGNKIEISEPFYIHRNLKIIQLSKQILTDTSNDIFVIENISDMSLIQDIANYDIPPTYKGTEIINWNNIPDNTKIILLDIPTRTSKYKDLIKLLQNLENDRNIHFVRYIKYETCDTIHIKYTDTCYQWLHTIGYHHQLMEYVETPKNNVTFSELLDTNGFILICGCPGIGKSQSMNQLSLEASPFAQWIMRVDLNNYQKYFKELKRSSSDRKAPKEHLKYFYGQTTENSHNLDNVIFDLKLQNGSMLIIFDGLDEIAPAFTQTVIEMIKTIKEANYQVVVTTRSGFQSRCENEFNVFGYEINVLRNKQQKRYLKRKFKSSARFIKKLFRKFDGNNLIEFLQIPLHIKLLSDVLVKKLINDKTVNDFSLNILELYTSFVEVKLDIYAEEKVKVDNINEDKINHEHMMYAIKELFEHSDEQCRYSALKNYVEAEIISFGRSLEDGDEKLGIINTKTKTFVHRTFAEYFAALWLFKNHKEDDNIQHQFAKNIIFLTYSGGRNFNRQLVLFLDLLAANKLKLHQLMILALENYDANDMSFEESNVVDKFGRTPLQLIIYHIRFIKTDLKYKLLQDLISITDDDPINYFGLNSYDYAKRYHSRFAEAHLLSKFEHFSRYLDQLNEFQIESISLCACEYGLDNLIRKLPYIPNLIKKSLTYKYSTLETEKLIERVVADTVGTNIEPNICILDFAKKYGHPGVLEALIEKTDDINQVDENDETPLMWAAKHSNLDVFQTMLATGADLEATNLCGRTVIEFAGENDNLEILMYLLET